MVIIVHICTLGSDQRPVCTCPIRYSLLNPNDQYSSCKPDFIQGREEDKLSPEKDIYYFEVLPYTDWPSSDYDFLRPYAEDKRKQSCMEDCMCAVAVFRNDNSCSKKRQPLSNGRVLGSMHNVKAFIKIRYKNSTTFPDQTRKNQDNLILMGLVILSGSVFVNIILIAAIFMAFY